MSFRAISVEGYPQLLAEPGPEPKLAWLPVADLVIDDRYQRSLEKSNWLAIRRIAESFRWSRFAPILVAPAEGGKYAVIDGQHRAHAALMCGIAQVPALMAEVDLVEQSRAFAQINSKAIKVSAFHIYRAAKAAGEDWALAADRACAAAGCTLMTGNRATKEKKARQVFSVAFIRKQIEAGQGGAITAALRAICAVPALDKAASFSDYLVKPWITAVVQAECLDHGVLVRALSGQNPFKVIERATLVGPVVALKQVIREAQTGVRA